MGITCFLAILLFVFLFFRSNRRHKSDIDFDIFNKQTAVKSSDNNQRTTNQTNKNNSHLDFFNEIDIQDFNKMRNVKKHFAG